MNSVQTLSPAQYWEWRTTITELDLAKEKLAKTELEYKLLMKDAEIHAIRQQLFLKTRMDSAKTALGQAQDEYERFKCVLEKSLSLSLNNKVIDDITFEIRDLPEQQTNTQNG